MNQEIFHQHKYKLFTVGAIGTFMATLDGSITNVALPTIARYLNAPINMIAWVALSYSLTLISLMLLFGVWAGKKGYLFSYRFGYLFFMAGSLICIFSTSFYILILGRVVQAIGTAMFAAIGPGMVTTVFPENERGKGLGLIVMMVAGGFMVGPPLGGFLLSYFSWHSIFIINIPIGLIGLYMTVRYFKFIPKPETKKKIQIKSGIAVSLGLVSLTFAISLIKEFNPADMRLWSLLGASIILFGLFFFLESKEKTAMIGLKMFRNRQFSNSLLAMIFMFIATSGVLILIPFYLEHIRHYEPQQVGFFLIILPIMMFIFAPIAGRVSDMIGYRILTAAGLLIMGGGLYLMSNLSAVSVATSIALTLVVIGLGNGLFNTPNSSALMGAVNAGQRPIASSIMATGRNIGMSFGIALSTALFAYFQDRFTSLGDEAEIFIKSYQMVIYVAMGMIVFGLFFSIIRGKRADNG